MLFRLSCLSIAMFSAQHAIATDGSLAFIQVTAANNYQHGINIDEYWKSEKLDGIRAIWNGHNLQTRSGKRIYAPTWFTDPLPNYAIEGELWAGRGHFYHVQQTVLDTIPNDEAWMRINLMLFDMPEATGDYQKRYFNIVDLVSKTNSKHVKYIEHTPIASEAELLGYLNSVNDEKGEGVMLRKINARYQAGRSNDMLKLKKHQDSEAMVIGYKLGQGKYEGLMGSVLVKLDNGVEFYIGSGFSDEVRKNPPKIGSTITFRFNGLTAEGKPRFARYLRERPTI
ncbi:DNA ligase [Vibrio aestuarianus]|uniref:DNA ligase n=1 Tax=Vibrio aestuarianus TaxID=28171 RepID=A0AAX3U8C4_9VIBR|nr:DNA ligase [Vibrio aestuarianus]MDE1212568.1 DNA ligase [Vibrio aestuarianus]MDE1216868.1 DNA ligase [Vibrio aestuarianus]MDE1224779.1 DNA ligase [Vibrio aestuarianus]MDE1228424.1 DNA ligase [Vibrio aestuarianus]MDE1237288.1 DNA ligase [Vibrio aestuarianus]